MHRRDLPLSAALAALIVAWSVPVGAADPSARLARLSCETDELAKFNGLRWECGTDLTGPVLLDGNGEPIGPTSAFEKTPRHRATVPFEVADVDQSGLPPDHTDLPEMIALRFTRSVNHVSPARWLPIGGTENLIFLSDDCSGTPYFTHGLENRPDRSFFGEAAVVVGPDGALQLWVPNFLPSTTIISVRSFFESDMEDCVPVEEFESIGLNCGPINDPEDPCESRAYHVHLTDDDLLDTFPPP